MTTINGNNPQIQPTQPTTPASKTEVKPPTPNKTKSSNFLGLADNFIASGLTTANAIFSGNIKLIGQAPQTLAPSPAEAAVNSLNVQQKSSQIAALRAVQNGGELPSNYNVNKTMNRQISSLEDDFVYALRKSSQDTHTAAYQNSNLSANHQRAYVIEGQINTLRTQQGLIGDGKANIPNSYDLNRSFNKRIASLEDDYVYALRQGVGEAYSEALSTSKLTEAQQRALKLEGQIGTLRTQQGLIGEGKAPIPNSYDLNRSFNKRIASLEDDYVYALRQGTGEAINQALKGTKLGEQFTNALKMEGQINALRSQQGLIGEGKAAIPNSYDLNRSFNKRIASLEDDYVYALRQGTGEVLQKSLNEAKLGEQFTRALKTEGQINALRSQQGLIGEGKAAIPNSYDLNRSFNKRIASLEDDYVYALRQGVGEAYQGAVKGTDLTAAQQKTLTLKGQINALRQQQTLVGDGKAAIPNSYDLNRSFNKRIASLEDDFAYALKQSAGEAYQGALKGTTLTQTQQKVVELQGQLDVLKGQKALIAEGKGAVQGSYELNRALSKRISSLQDDLAYHTKKLEGEIPAKIVESTRRQAQAHLAKGGSAETQAQATIAQATKAGTTARNTAAKLQQEAEAHMASIRTQVKSDHMKIGDQARTQVNEKVNAFKKEHQTRPETKQTQKAPGMSKGMRYGLGALAIAGASLHGYLAYDNFKNEEYVAGMGNVAASAGNVMMAVPVITGKFAGMGEPGMILAIGGAFVGLAGTMGNQRPEASMKVMGQSTVLAEK